MLPKALNDLSESAAAAQLQRCCGSSRWVQEMLRRRPFPDMPHLLKAAEDVWWQLSDADWKEAFAHHPKIGNVENLRKKFAATADWSRGEQQAVGSASEATVQELAALNDEYEKKFGYIFIVCATGKSADEMLAILKERLPNDAKDEVRVAAREQSKITAIRLEKLCKEAQSQPMC